MVRPVHQGGVDEHFAFLEFQVVRRQTGIDPAQQRNRQHERHMLDRTPGLAQADAARFGTAGQLILALQCFQMGKNR